MLSVGRVRPVHQRWLELVRDRLQGVIATAARSSAECGQNPALAARSGVVVLALRLPGWHTVISLEIGEFTRESWRLGPAIHLDDLACHVARCG